MRRQLRRTSSTKRPIRRESLFRELHRPYAQMPASDPPEVQQRSYALAWIHERYRGHPLLVHNGIIDGFTVHLGFVRETEQGLIVLINRDSATEALMALAYSAYDRMLGLAPLDWASRLQETPIPTKKVRSVAVDFPIEEVVGKYEHPGYGELAVEAESGQLRIEFRTLRLALIYRGRRRFLTREAIPGVAPQIAVRFSVPKAGKPPKLFIPLNFDSGDPVEVFTRVQ